MFVNKKNGNYWLWHRRITHIHMHNLNKLTVKNLVDDLPNLKFEKNKVCETCKKGKHYNLSLFSFWFYNCKKLTIGYLIASTI